MNNSDEIIKKLQMIPHPEGGYFKESYRNENISLIYYLLKKNEKSHWHRLTKNETLHFYSGDPLRIYMSDDEINVNLFEIGKNNNFHYTIKSGTWFAMKSTGNYSLIGCSVAPAFDYKDFELAAPDWSPKNFNQDL